MTTEPPRGIKANLQRSYSNIISDETYILNAVESLEPVTDQLGEASNTGGGTTTNNHRTVSPTHSNSNSPFDANQVHENAPSTTTRMSEIVS